MKKNKIYICEWKGENQFGGKSHFCIVVAASDIETARSYVKEKIGIDVSPTWLMGAEHETMYNTSGNKPLDIQAKILFNSNCHTHNK